jgi:uncharacterized membrane protein YeaQ/YmgE (transglycosylase-associated protein family)
MVRGRDRSGQSVPAAAFCPAAWGLLGSIIMALVGALVLLYLLRLLKRG